VRFYVKTFGCKVNQFESEYFINSLIKKGFKLTDSEKDSNVVIVNSCAVTNEAERQLRQYLRKLRRNFENIKIVLTGCAVDCTEKFNKELFDTIVSNYYKQNLPSIISENSNSTWLESIFNQKEFVELKAEESFQHTRKFFKIQDGCSNYCSYCIIPYVRGVPRSLPEEKVLENLIYFSEKFREVVLTGINVEMYGKDLGIRNGFLKLMESIENELDKRGVKDFRLRVTSLKPDKVLYNYVDFVAESKYFAPHFHISVQNFNNKVLKLMNRNYTSEDIFNIVAKIREKIANAGIGADMITGFIGEGEMEFEDNLKKIGEIDINFFHIFPFSRRNRTKAEKLNETCDNKEKKRRVKILKKITDRKKEEFIKRNLFRKFSVLVEKEEDGYFTGYSENYIKIFIQRKNHFTLKNKFVNVYGKKIKDRFFIEAEL